jgi:peptidoglycan/xylan/chitin deacetylase (PgdA/CDA1 family)
MHDYHEGNGEPDGQDRHMKYILIVVLLVSLIGQASALVPVSYTCCKSFSDNGTMLENMDTKTNWTLGGGLVNNDTINFTEGTKGLKITSTNAVNGYITRTTFPSNATNISNVAFDVYVDNASNLNSMYLQLHNNSSVAIKATKYITAYTGWNRYVINFSTFTLAGGDLYTNSHQGGRFVVTSNSGVTVNVTIDNLVYNINGQANLIYTFDDGYKNITTYAKPILDANNQKAASFVIMSFTQNPLWLNLTNLHSLQSANWDISSHSYFHNGLTSVNASVLNNETAGAKAYLVANGFAKSAEIFAYPGGAWNNTVLDSVKASYKIGRIYNTNTNQKHLSTVVNSSYLIQVKDMQNTVTVANAKTYINDTIAQKGLLVLGFHDLVLSGQGESTTRYNISAFNDIVNFSVLSGINVVTFSDYLVPVTNYAPIYQKNVTIFSNGSLGYIDNNMNDEFTVNMTSVPSSDSININVTQWNETGDYYKKWNESSSNATLTTTHTIGDFPANTSIQIKKNGVNWNAYTSNSTGYISFNYADGYSDIQFEAENATISEATLSPEQVQIIII